MVDYHILWLALWEWINEFVDSGDFLDPLEVQEKMKIMESGK